MGSWRTFIMCAMNPSAPAQDDPFARKGLFLPYVWIAVLGVAAVSTIGFVVVKAIANGGLMPAPSVLVRYICPGPVAPFSFYFLHGDERVRIQSASGQRTGTLLNGKIDWAAPAAGAPALGFAVPTEITYDDVQSLRISGAGFSQLSCTRAHNAGAAP